MITIKEYAELHGKSVQAVYKQLKSKENATLLEGHIITKKINNKNVKMLDDIAVQILNDASKQSIQVIMQNDDRERIEQLETENKTLLIKIASLQEELITTQKELGKEKDNVKVLQSEKIELLEQKNQQESKTKWWKFWK